MAVSHLKVPGAVLLVVGLLAIALGALYAILSKGERRVLVRVLLCFLVLFCMLLLKGIILHVATGRTSTRTSSTSSSSVDAEATSK